MKTLKLRDGFYWTGIIDDQLRVFDIVMYTEFGTTYNSYALTTGGKTVLFETAKVKFFDEYLDKLRQVIDVNSIDYLVMSHTEPDHAGSVEKLLDYSPQMKILATPCAVGFLKEIVNRDFVSLPVKDGQQMKIGERTLRFMAVPNLHWPDTMYTFIEEEQILVTCDSFGAHYCLPEVLRSKVQNEQDYQKALKYYFDCIIGPFKPFMLRALDRVEPLDVTLVCTGHGPVLDSRIRETFAQYRQWSTIKNPNDKKTVIIPYVSAYGYTGQLAEAIAQGIAASGDVAVRRYDMVEADPAKVEEELLFADGFLLGTPTIVGQALRPIWELTLEMFPATHGGKLAGAFGSYGWSGEGVPNITERLRQLKLKVVDGFRVRFKPSEADLVGAYEYGYQFGCRLLDKPLAPPEKKGGRKLVKCLVCGEIFDASLDVCPVCGVGRENFVPVEDAATGYRRDSQEYYLILGGGAAALNAARAIRERDTTGSIVMVSEEPYAPYNRPMLTKALLAGLTPEQLAMESPEWYQENRVYQVLGKRAEQVDLAKREVTLSGGEVLQFTKLIYALGSECFIPPMPGSELEGVVAVRRLADVRRVEALMKQTKHAVVIGGGVLGLEAAWELKKAGLSVTVLEVAPRLMPRQLDETAAALLTAAAEKAGIAVRTGAAVKAIQGSGRAEAVVLENGERFQAGLVIVSAGVRANTALAGAMGLQTGRAVLVNERMETSAPGVYACGDCAEYQGMNLANWAQAVDQGKVAGANAAGEALTYAPTLMGLTFQGMNTALFAAGDNGSNPALLYKTLEFRDAGKGQYRKFYFLNDRLCGGILLGDTSAMAALTAALQSHATYKQMRESELMG